jgi:hypothetical protein
MAARLIRRQRDRKRKSEEALQKAGRLKGGNAVVRHRLGYANVEIDPERLGDFLVEDLAQSAMRLVAAPYQFALLKPRLIA